LLGRTRDIFEEALATISTARDFGIVFNAYMKFEEQMIEAELQEEEDQDSQEEEDDDDIGDQIDTLIEHTFRAMDLGK
jgi:pre-mRNA-splicing factor SYF1